ncbi:hypothetical protein [Kitasatospora griseola]
MADVDDGPGHRRPGDAALPHRCVVGGVRGRVIGVGSGPHNGATVVLPIAPAFVVTVPVDRRPIGRGLGHAVVHAHH